MKKGLKTLLKLLLFILLTIITQIGGVVYLVSLYLNYKWKIKFKFKPSLLFLAIYLFFTLLVVPLVAPIFGREKVKHTSLISPTNYLTVLLNRNYVRPGMNKLLADVESKLQGTGVEIHYLDANFPFINKFPLLPHLSHNDGKKLDISLIYETKEGKITNKQKSTSGYGVFENPKKGEYNQIEKCFKQGYWQYDIGKYVQFGKNNEGLVFSNKGTKIMIESILKSKHLGKLLIEPHLKKRLNLNNNKVRYQGCRATHHDDHIHIQLR